jgi:hypothetical protein
MESLVEKITFSVGDYRMNTRVGMRRTVTSTVIVGTDPIFSGQPEPQIEICSGNQ